jgi:hypothetical protein
VTGTKEETMQHADARFERTQPAELRRIPFTEEEMNLVPGAVEAIGWAVLAIASVVLFVGFLGL